MADRRSEATLKAAGETRRKSTSTRLTQKERAIRYGGRYREGGKIYTVGPGQEQITRKKNKQGGFTYTAKLKDSVGASGSLGGYTVRSIQRAKSVREQAQDISAGRSKPYFIGPSSKEVTSQQTTALRQQKFKPPREYPETYVDSEGRPLVTITGSSPDTDFTVYEKSKGVDYSLSFFPDEEVQGPGKPIYQTQEQPAGPWLVAKERPRTGPEYVAQTLKNIGIDIASTELSRGVPLYTKPVLEGLQQERKTGQIDRLLNPEVGEFQYGEQFKAELLAYVGTGLIGGGRLPKLKTPKITKPSLSKQPVQPFKQTVMRDIFKQDTALYGFTEQKIGLGKAGDVLTKRIDRSPIKPIDIDPNYRVPKLPVSRFPQTYGTGLIVDKIRLGRGVVRQPLTKIKTTVLSLGRGKGVRPGKDFTQDRVNLGRGITPEPKLQAKSIQPSGPVKIDKDFRVPRLPAQRFRLTKDDTALYGIRQQRINLGRGIGQGGQPIKGPVKPVDIDPNYRVPRLPVSRFDVLEPSFSSQRISLGIGLSKQIDSGGAVPRPTRITRPPSKPSREDEIRVSRGLISIMKTPVGQFTSTKIALGKSEQTLQIRGGKTIQDSISKKKAASSTSFLIATRPDQIYGIETETIAYPPGTSEKLISRQIQRPELKTTITPRQGIITGTKPIQREITTLKPIQITRESLRQRQPQRQRERQIFRTPTRTPPRQTPILKQPQKQPLKERQILKVPEPKRPILIPIPAWGQKPERREKRKEPAPKRFNIGFIGSTNIETVEGFRTRKSDITYGDVLTSKLARKNIQKTRGKSRGVRFF